MLCHVGQSSRRECRLKLRDRRNIFASDEKGAAVDGPLRGGGGPGGIRRRWSNIQVFYHFLYVIRVVYSYDDCVIYYNRHLFLYFADQWPSTLRRGAKRRENRV